MDKTGGKLADWRRVTGYSLAGGAVCLAVSMAFLLICALLISTGFLDQSNLFGIVFSACILGSLVGGLFTCIHWPSRKLLGGLVASLTGFCSVVLLRLAISGSLAGWTHIFGIFFGCLCGGLMAGLVTAGKKRKKKRRTH